MRINSKVSFYLRIKFSEIILLDNFIENKCNNFFDKIDITFILKLR